MYRLSPHGGIHSSVARHWSLPPACGGHRQSALEASEPAHAPSEHPSIRALTTSDRRTLVAGPRLLTSLWQLDTSIKICFQQLTRDCKTTGKEILLNEGDFQTQTLGPTPMEIALTTMEQRLKQTLPSNAYK